jgi:uncharacterized membrane protein YgaE (UPF0421/DUF939 family)
MAMRLVVSGVLVSFCFDFLFFGKKRELESKTKRGNGEGDERKARQDTQLENKNEWIGTQHNRARNQRNPPKKKAHGQQKKLTFHIVLLEPSVDRADKVVELFCASQF